METVSVVRVPFGRSQTKDTLWSAATGSFFHSLKQSDDHSCVHTVTTDAGSLRKPLAVGGDLYMEANLSANSICDVLRRLLTAYDIQPAAKFLPGRLGPRGTHLADAKVDRIPGDAYNEDSLSSQLMHLHQVLVARSDAERLSATTNEPLAVSLGASMGIVPPGVQHVHAGGGDTTHGHGERNEMARDGSHDHESDHEHHDHAKVSDRSLLADYVLHLHWRLLGVEFSMPVPEEPADGNDESTIPPAVVRVMYEEGPTTQSGRSFGRVMLAFTCTPNVDVVQNLEAVPRPPNLVTSVPLCDSARLERSGVLRA